MVLQLLLELLELWLVGDGIRDGFRFSCSNDEFSIGGFDVVFGWRVERGKGVFTEKWRF